LGVVRGDLGVSAEGDCFANKEIDAFVLVPKPVMVRLDRAISLSEMIARSLCIG